MPELHFEALHPDFGAKVTGLSFTDRLSQEIVSEIQKAIDQYSLLHFPNQKMNDESHMVITRCLGEPEAEHVTYGKTGKIVYFGTVGNVMDDDSKKDGTDPSTLYQKGNELWHSDSSFRKIPSYFSITHAYEVPGEGGETEFASMRSAYARLPREKQEKIENLSCIHDYVFSRSPVAPVNPKHAASLPPVEHKLVRTNPVNGLKNYFVGSHARSVVGWHGVESRKLLDDLLEWSTQPKDVYSHKWAAGDTVVWDNRCLLHRGAGYNADRWRRRMRQTRVAGKVCTLEEP